MLLSIALILLVGMSMGWICKKIKLPSLLGMMITGMTLGPYVLNLLDDSILGISAELRKIALIIILTRAGLGLDLSGLKKIGRPAVMMCFVPATFEIVGIVLLAPKLMGLSILEAAIMGAVLAAVSPAVVVPRMVKLMEEGYGVKQGIPQLILAGASVDDVYVIVLFSTFTGMMQGQSTSILSFINIPVSIFLGIGIGLLIGSCLAYYFKKVHIRILQCDDQVRSDQLITSAEELKAYMEHLKLYGNGGTDFRPAFTYVNQLLAAGEFQNLKGLLYFTDGKGTFPGKRPPYETAFILFREDYKEVTVPAWAIRLVLDEEDL